MSRVRGVFPLFLATSFGIINGVFVFAPAFKEQQQEKLEQAKNPLGIASQSENDVYKLRQAEAESRLSTETESVLDKEGSSTSWWPNLKFWARDTAKIDEKTTIAARAEDSERVTKEQERNGK